MQNLFDEWKKNFDQFKVQANLGKMEMVDAFEKQKEQLKNWVNETKEKLDQSGEKAEAHVQNLKVKLEELNLQLYLGKAETKEAFEEQRKKIEAALHEVTNLSKKTYETGFGQAMQIFDHQADWVKTNLEILQLQFSLAKMDAKTDYESVKKDINQKIQELQTKSSQWQELAKDNLEQWNGLAQDNMEKFRTWIQNIGK